MLAQFDQAFTIPRSTPRRAIGDPGLASIADILSSVVGPSIRAEALASTSLRKLSPAMVVYKQQATTFAGLECGITHFYVLKVFKDAAPALGLKPQVVVCVEQLWRSSRPQDWEPRRRPIVWPSNASLCAALGISESRLKELIRHICELGLVVMEDSPSGRRDGKRNKAGRILEAWGFDLSLFAVRMAEFKRLTDEWRARQARLKQLHKERSRARKEAQQLVDSLQTAGLIDEVPADFAGRVERADIAAKRAKDIAALEASTAELRQLAEEARAVVVRAHAAASGAAEESPEPGPEGPENRPLTLTKEEELKKVLVVALEGGCETAGGSGSASGSASPEGAADARAAEDGGAGQYTFLIRPAELVHLVPALRLHIASTHPTRFDIIEAARRAAASLGIPQRLWGDACVALGRYNAALAIAVVTSKPTTYFTSSPSAYLAGMVARHRKRTLNLDRSIRALRQRAATGDSDGNIGLQSEVRFPTAGRWAMEPSMCSREQGGYASG